MATPIPKFRFLAEIEGIDLRFTEISGLDKETEVIEIRHGNDSSKYKQQILGLNKTNRVTMKRGVINDASIKEFYDWWALTTNQQKTEDAQRDVTIKLMDEIGDPIITWKLSNAMAVKFQSTDLKSDGNEIAIDSMEIVHEGLTIV
ncbi:MAG: phage tail protein [Bacteroidota bacterium]